MNVKQNQYWHGNSAKTIVIDRLLVLLAHGPLTVFDFGCGGAGDWPAVLTDHPSLNLCYWDPHSGSLANAKQRLTGFANARPVNPADTLLVDAVVSFSVFEHVADRLGYLKTIERVLRPGGMAYLNYDDGHFRTNIDLHQSPASWRMAIKEEVRNRLSVISRRFGRTHHLFQRRVTDSDLSTLLASTNLAVESEFYSNMTCFKGLCKTMPKELEGRFVDFWVDVEKRLNTEFQLADQYMGSLSNLWRIMPSKTIVLRKDPEVQTDP